VCLDPDSVRILLYPKDAPTLDSWSTEVDSVVVRPGPDYSLVEARASSSVSNSCVSDPENHHDELRYFLLLRGGRVLQSFQLTTQWGQGSTFEDTSYDTNLRVTPERIDLEYKVTEWHAKSPPSDSSETVVKETGRLHYEYDPEKARFLRMR
jgi:hypothetical protein